MKHRVLISTIPPFEGGVPMMARILSRHLRARGHDVTLAYYATVSQGRAINVPTWKAWTGARPSLYEHEVFDGIRAVQVGNRCPELEVPYYLPSDNWRRLIAAHDRHVAVGGNVLVSNPFLDADVPHLIWCATDFFGDRADRQKTMSGLRRLWDKGVVVPRMRALERKVLAAGRPTYCISHFTERVLRDLGLPDGACGYLPVPTDCDLFTPPDTPARPGIVGFAGRINDPRKNLPLLLDAIKLARADGHDLAVRLTGTPDDKLTTDIAVRGLTDVVTCVGDLPREALPDFYRGLDVFVLPSRQEGLGIVGVEALACGVPVVSTRCGGPEDFVDDGENGYLVDSDARTMADRLIALTSDRARRDAFSQAARTVAVTRYGLRAWEEAVGTAWRQVWGDRP